LKGSRTEECTGSYRVKLISDIRGESEERGGGKHKRDEFPPVATLVKKKGPPCQN